MVRMSFLLAPFFAQNFSFLSRGAKVKVYASNDGRTVLKLPVNAEELAAWFVADGRPLLATGWIPGAKDELEAARILLARTEASYRLARSTLSGETGLIDVHLDPTTNLRLSIHVDGRILDADRASYILQWRAKPLRVCIDSAMAADNPYAAEAMLDDLIEFMFALWARGIVDETANFHTNYGYKDFETKHKQLILFDIGELVKSEDRVLSERAAPKLLRKKGMAWLERRYPDLARFFIERFREALNA